MNVFFKIWGLGQGGCQVHFELYTRGKDYDEPKHRWM
jgi:hypothetical protein